MNLQKKNLLRRMSILVSLLLAISSLSACSGDDDEVGNAGTVTAKSIVGVWYELGSDNVSFTFSESGKVRYCLDNGNTQYTKDFGYEIAGDGGYFTGNWQDSFEFIGPYIFIPDHYFLYKKDSLGKGSLSDFKGEFSNNRGETITFNGDGTGKTNWIFLDSFTIFQYTSEGKNCCKCGFDDGEYSAIIYKDRLYVGGGDAIKVFFKVK